jgi:hypothetical protein
MADRTVFDALRLLMPRDVPACAKIRIGGPGDGGYVLLDRLDSHQIVMSFGVGPTVTFDAELAARGHVILLFDHTVDGLPQDHPNMRWFRQGVCGTSDRAADLATLAEHMALLPPDATDPILKIDVEGAEWTALGEADPADLRRFAQITMELHDLLRLNEPAFRARALRMLARLDQDFAVVHVHANNWSETGEIGGLRMADALELTWARRDLFPTIPSRTVYPTALDTPNCDFRPDIPLDFWPFHPGAERLEFPG